MSFGFGFGFPRRLTSGGGLSPSLYLDFVGTGVLPSTVTFSRGTNATLTDSNGRIAWAPHNLLTNSEDFEAAGWTKSGLNTTGTPPWVNVAVAPDGTTTAERLIEDTSTGTHQIYVLPGLGINTYTRTIYAKANGRTQFELTQESGGNARFTLTGAGTAVALGSNTVSIQALDNGWYRCSSTFTVTGIFGLYLVLYNGSTTNYTGDGTSGILVWGAQLNVANAPVNLLTWSEDFTNAAWTPLGIQPVTQNSTTAPNGTVTADTVTADASASAQHNIQQGPLSSPAGTYTFSASLKYNNNRWLGVAIYDTTWRLAAFDIQNGVVGTAIAPGVTASITNQGNGWYRCQVTYTTATASLYGGVFLLPSDTTSRLWTTTGVEAFYLWGAQLNTGSVALPYVATTSSIYLPPAYNSTTPKNLLGFTQEPENAAWTKSNSYVQQNLLLQSNDFQTSWAATNTTRTLNSTTSPSGGTDGVKIEATTTAVTQLFQGAIVTATSATGSVYVKQGTSATVANAFVLRNGTTATNLVAGTLNYSTGVFTYTTGSTGVIVTNAGNGWWRISLSATSGITSGDTIQFFVGFDGFSITAGNHFFAYGAQLVQGSTAGDYTQTTSAAAPTRYLNYDGTLTGRKLVEDTALANHGLSVSFTYPATSVYVLSVYAKQDTRSRLELSADTADAQAYCLFNLATGTVIQAGTSVTPTITPVGGGWYRCAIALTVASGAKTIRLRMGNSANDYFYTGDGTSGIYVSDFQLSNSASVDPYVYNPQAAAASAAYYGPRFDYDPVTLASRGLLIEEARANLFVRSEEFDVTANWTPSNLTVTANTDTAPNGTLSADTLTATAANAVIQQAASVTNATVYTYSVWIKRKTGTGAVALSDLNGNYFSVTVDATWTRFSLTSTAASTTGRGYIRLTTSGDEVYVWGAQLEAGSFATSYIPTVASQVTRNADSASMLGDNFYTWYNINQGSWTSEFASFSTGNAWVFAVTTSAGQHDFVKGATTVNYRYGNGVNSDNPLTITLGSAIGKFAGAYTLNGTHAAAINGSAVTTTGVSAAPTETGSLRLGTASGGTTPLNGTIRRIGYYNTRLPNATLQALTV